MPTLAKIKDSKKVAIYSANLIEVDWEERTQGRFILDGWLGMSQRKPISITLYFQPSKTKLVSDYLGVSIIAKTAEK